MLRDIYEQDKFHAELSMKKLNNLKSSEDWINMRIHSVRPVFIVGMNNADALSYPFGTLWLGGCPGWSVFAGCKADLMDLSHGGSVVNTLNSYNEYLSIIYW